MASIAEIQGHNEQSTATLLQGILSDVQDLIKQQLQLTRVEIKSDFQKSLEGALVLAAGAGGCLVGTFLFGMMLVYLVYELFAPAHADPSSFPLWACYGVVAASVTGVSALVAWSGYHRISAVKLAEKTVEGLKENVGWQLDNKK
jgi:Putative Actinobacterial Holin-X, holin superfamily III